MSNFFACIDEFSNNLLIERGLSINTVKSYNQDILQYNEYLNKIGIIDVNSIKQEHINEFISYLHDINLKPRSISRKITALKMFHKFLFLNNYVKENVSSFIHQPKLEKTLPTVLSLEEINRLLDSFSESNAKDIRDKTMIELMYSTGLRVSELVNLNIEDIHLTMGYLRCKGKGSKERIVPVGNRALALLQKYIGFYRKQLNIHYDQQVLFLDYRGLRFTRQGFFTILKEQAKIINLNVNLSPHKLRHTFATHLLENNVDIRFIQELLGHSDISSTQIYTHINSKKLNKIIEDFHPRDKQINVKDGQNK